MSDDDRETLSDPRVHTPADLDRLWRRLMGELGFARPQIWVLMLDRDGRLGPPAKIEDLPFRPGPDAGERMAWFVEEQTRFAQGFERAFLFARPGPAGRTPDDLAWARLLAPLSPWPVHLANDHELRVVAPDDLVERRSA